MIIVVEPIVPPNRHFSWRARMDSSPHAEGFGKTEIEAIASMFVCRDILLKAGAEYKDMNESV